jgi:cyclase
VYRPRLIPVLLLDGRRALKTIQFKERIDLGDPVNAVSIFNTFRVDEIVVLDIGATNARRSIDLGLMRDIASEARMPFSIGGGVRTVEQVATVLSMGAERVVLSSALHEDPRFVADAVRAFGSSSITACIDVGTDWMRRTAVYINSGKRRLPTTPLDAAKRAEELGVGEIILQSIGRDGMMDGYDVPLLSEVSAALRVPVVALGGAGTLQHMREAYASTEVSALASGSFFFFKGKGRGVLISYPDRSELNQFTSIR